MHDDETGGLAVDTARPGDEEIVATVRTADEAVFGGLAERHRHELRVHCYRMLGSYDEAEDLVQETFLRAWRRRDSYLGRSTFRAWLYRIATNACLDLLRRHPRQPAGAPGPAVPGGAGGNPPPATTVPWLQPYPDHLLDLAASGEAEPPTAAVARETIELAFLVAIQHLPPRQRAVVILRDVLGWSARETADLLDSSVAAVNSAVQRARPVLRHHLPPDRDDWTTPPASAAERAVLRRYLDALAQRDEAALSAVLRADARASHQAGAAGHDGEAPAWYAGRDAIVAAWAPLLRSAYTLALTPTAANRQPAIAAYLQPPGDTVANAFGLTVLRISDGLVAEVATFGAELFPAFGLPPTR